MKYNNKKGIKKLKVYFFSYDINIAYLISAELEKRNFDCTPFTKLGTIVEAIHTSKSYPEIILMDYMVFNHDFFNVFGFLRERKLYFPILFYNDPYIFHDDQIINWRIHLEKAYHAIPIPGPKDTVKFVEQYKDLLKALYEIIIESGLWEYIPCMQKTKKLPEEYSIQNRLEYANKNKEDPKNIRIFISRNNLKKNLAFLLEFFSKTENIPVSYEEIREYYQKYNMDIKESCIPVLISNLRKEISKDPQCNFMITKSRAGYIFTSE